MARLVKPDGKKICDLCDKKGWGAQELSNAAELALATVTKLMKGEPCFRQSLMMVAEALETHYTSLVQMATAITTADERRYEFHIHLSINKIDLDEEKIIALFELLKKSIDAKGDIDMTDLDGNSTIITISLNASDSFRLLAALAEDQQQLLNELGAEKITLGIAHAHYLGSEILSIPNLIDPSPFPGESVTEHKEFPLQ